MFLFSGHTDNPHNGVLILREADEAI